MFFSGKKYSPLSSNQQFMDIDHVNEVKEEVSGFRPTPRETQCKNCALAFITAILFVIIIVQSYLLVETHARVSAEILLTPSNVESFPYRDRISN